MISHIVVFFHPKKSTWYQCLCFECSRLSAHAVTSQLSVVLSVFGMKFIANGC